MLRDGRETEPGAEVDCDVCIVGAGPAGLTAAAEFLDGEIRVVVLESGAFEPDAATQLLSRCTVEENEDLYPDPYWSHDRGVGGTSSQWDVLIKGRPHVHLMPLDPIDFRKRPWVPHSGWPIDERELGRYVLRAQLAADAGPFDYRPQAWMDDACKPFASSQLATRMVSFGHQEHFQKTLPQRVVESRNVTLMTWSTAVELEGARNGEAVTAIRVACLDGRRFRMKPRMIILAQGAFEVPRLLLASRSIHEAGLGNQNDLVGRFLMDRQIVRAGTLVPASPGGLRRFAFYDMRLAQDRHVLGKLTLSENVVEAEGLLGNLISFAPLERFSAYQLAHRPFGRGTTYRSPAHHSLRTLAAAWRQKRFPPPDVLQHFRRIAAGLDDLFYVKVMRRMKYRPEFNFDSLGWHAAENFERRFSTLEVHQMCEQSPDYGNRVTLGAALDATGLPQAHVIFRWNGLDAYSIVRTQDKLKEELARAGIGALKLERRGGQPLLAQMSAHHPSGTTRMDSSPRRGVVDPACRVHGVNNLFIASSSVFPTSGYAPPTLTILALTIRVCDQIKSRMRAPDLFETPPS